ncbi:Neutral protease 2 [Cercospora zeina]
MKTIFPTLVGLIVAGSGAAASHAMGRRTPFGTLDVTLQATGNTKVMATVTNFGDEAYNLYFKNTLLDTSAVDKVVVTVDQNKVPSNGLRLVFSRYNLSPTHFLKLEPGGVHQVELDIAETHRLQDSPHGLLGESHMLATSWFYTSTRNKPLSYRNHCSSSQAYIIAQGQRYVTNWAQRAANAVATGSPTQLFNAYWKSRTFINDIETCYRGIADEAAGIGGDKITIACRDTGTGNSCAGEAGEDPPLAFAREYDNLMVLCPPFWDSPIIVNTCSPDEDSQVATLIHELTHFQNVCGHSCDDLVYGRASSKALPSSDAVDNADTYALFAEDYINNCSG